MYQPRQEQAVILDRAMDFVQGVPYQVTARWLFYCLLQEGIYSAKGDYKNRFLPLLSRARKRFYDGWHPDILADDTRRAVVRGTGFIDEQDWLEAIGKLDCPLDKWAEQPNYVELWFEAKAMRAQFEHYTDHITLVPFGGDPSIAYKWAIAKRLEARAEAYGKPLVILYFGDLDPKGLTIPESAAADISGWCEVDFEFIRCALNPGNEVIYNIPENPDKPGQYQWEALSDKMAGKLITQNLGKFINKGSFIEVKAGEAEITARFSRAWADFLKNLDPKNPG